jgi:hypothetical protein
METVAQETPIGLVLAHAEFDSERNHTSIRRQPGAQSVILAEETKARARPFAAHTNPSSPAASLELSFNLHRLKHRCLFLRMTTGPDGFWMNLEQDSRN